ncbi:MRG-domain-containing protein [Absidia repens]|uniref:Chromatin modification-related protein EAF3 n=1 Tax=Absidia repens TaxID=90262 RepID=A0A1X2I5K6_9FUNG|nr:MRG-domain-containing protein [Absidia repens]
MVLSASSTNSHDQRILCYHGPLIYEAKILDRKTETDDCDKKKALYLVHYQGWNKKWDEWVDDTRILAWNEENLALQKRTKESYSTKNERSKKSRNGLSSTSSSASRKRTWAELEGKGHTKSDSLHSVEARLDIPETLKCLLVDDWEYITKNQQLVPLPREPTITQILTQYKKHTLESKSEKEGDSDLLDEVTQGLSMYFNKALGSLLLYQFERQQYSDLRRKHPNKDMTDIYGAEHLLRLYVQLPSLISHTSLDATVISALADHLGDILQYIQKRQKHFFVTEYQNATPSYVSLVNGT